MSELKWVPSWHPFLWGRRSAAIGVERRLAAETWLVLAFGLAATWVWVAAVGRDLSWDTLNHHLYLPFSLLSGRYRSDLFAAGPQSYQNPLGYLPFYALVRTGWPSWIVGAMLAACHALAVWPLHRLARAVWGDAPAERQWRLLALALAWSAPVFLLVAGTSSIDVIANVLVLGALAAVFTMTPNSAWLALLAGVALGIAFAIKPVNAVFVLAVGGISLLRCLLRQQRWRAFFALVLGSTAASVLMMGFWCEWLWHSFGNPLFPLFNNYFHSAFAPQQALIADRFIPQSLLDYVLRPWQLAQYQSFSALEKPAPDIRPLLATLLGLAVLARACLHRRLPWRDTLSRADVQLLVFSAISYVLWMKTSGNARYVIPLFMLVGLLLARAAQLVLPAPAARVLLVLTLLLQMAYYGHDGEHRFASSAWDDKPYLNVEVAPRLVQQPFLHLSIGTLSFASLAPYLNPNGAMINIIGQMSLPTTGPLGEALEQRLRHWKGRTRFLFSATTADGRVQPTAQMRKRADGTVYRFGLRFDFNDCEPIRIRRPGVHVDNDIALLSCAALPRTADRPGFAAERERADRVFATLEAQCPKVLGPSPMASDTDLDTWFRSYANSEAKVSVSFTEGVKMSHFRSMNLANLGTADEVTSGHGLNACKAWHLLFPQ